MDEITLLLAQARDIMRQADAAIPQYADGRYDDLLDSLSAWLDRHKAIEGWTLKNAIRRWIVENVDESVVSGSDALVDAIAYNLLRVLDGSPDRYDYSDDQDQYLRDAGYDLDD